MGQIPMPRIVCFEGNIGAGKSTAIHAISKELQKRGFRVQTLCEPVSTWVQCNETGTCTGRSTLGNFYDNPGHYALHFQMVVLCSHHDRNDSIDPDADFVLMERSPSSSIRVFSKTIHEQGHVTTKEFEALETFAAKIIRDRPLDTIIYLQCAPEVAFARIHQRARPEEIQDSGISMEYLEELHQRHETWLIEEGGASTTFNVTNVTQNTAAYTSMCTACVHALIKPETGCSVL